MSDEYQANSNTLSDVVWPVDEKIAVKKDPARPYVGLEHIGTRHSQLLGWATSDSSVSVNSVFEKGDVLFGKLRPNLRKCVSAPFAGYCSTDILVLRARPGNDPMFAARIFQTEAVGMEAERTSMGTKMPRTSWKGLSQFRINLPDLPHQSKIAEILDTLDEAIRGTGAVVAKLTAVKQGLLHDLLTRGIDANGDLRPPYAEAPHLYHQTPLGWLPQGWEVATLGGVLSAIDSGWSPACIETPPSVGEWGVLKVSSVTRGFYDDQEAKTLPSHLRPKPALEVRNGDVILTRANGVAELVGKTVQVTNTQEKLMLSDKLLRLIPDKKQMTNDFLALVMGSDLTVRQLEKVMSGSSGQKNISQAQIKSFACVRPPVSEQNLITTQIRALYAREGLEEETLAKFRLQKSGLMEDLLTGRVSVAGLLAPDGSAHGA